MMLGVVAMAQFYRLQRHAMAVDHVTVSQFVTGLFVYCFLFSVFVMLPVTLRRRGPILPQLRLIIQAFRENPSWFFKLSTFGVLLQFVNVYLFSIPFRFGWGTPSEFTAVDSTSTLWSGILGRVFYRERIKPTTWVGGFLLLSGVLLLYLNNPMREILPTVTSECPFSRPGSLFRGRHFACLGHPGESPRIL